MQYFNSEWLAIPALVLLFGYHLLLLLKIKGKPDETTFGRLQRARSEWLETVVGQNAILAVQTLRNSVMSATFLASTAMLISLGSLQFVLSAPSLELVLIAQVDPWLIQVKLLTVSALMFFIFFNFSLALRAYNHVGFLAGLNGPQSLAIAKRMLAQASRHYTFGMRGYYSTVPVILWLFGGGSFLLGVLLLLLLLIYLDH